MLKPIEVTNSMKTSKGQTTLPLTINLLHGEGFKNANPCTAMHVYVKAQIKGDRKINKTTKTTKLDWNSQTKFNLDETKLVEQNLELVLKVKASSPLFLVNKKIGEVRLPIKDLYNGVPAEEMMTWTSLRCHVVSGSGRIKGAVYFSYRFGSHGDEVEYRKVVPIASAPPLPPIGVFGDDLVEMYQGRFSGARNENDGFSTPASHLSSPYEFREEIRSDGDYGATKSARDANVGSDL